MDTVNDNYEELLNVLFSEKKRVRKKWNYQSNGRLYFSDGSTFKEKEVDALPLFDDSKYRIAKHPYDEVYAYASSRCNGIEEDRTSCICLYYPSLPSKLKVYHKLDKDLHGFDYKPAFSPNGKWLAFISMKEYGKIGPSGTIMIVSYKGSNDHVYTLSATKNLPCQEFQWLNNNTILVEYKINGYSQVMAISFDSKNPSRNNRRFVIGKLRLDEKVERGDKLIASGFNYSTDNNQDISFLNPGNVERCEYVTRDSIKSYYWFAHPNPDKDNRRTLLLCQGGPHFAWEPEIEAGTYHIPFLQHLGYSIIMPIVRGMPGICFEFDNQIRGDWGGQCIVDYLTALDTAIEYFHLDKDNVALMGHSFGGFCAYSMNVQHPERFRCFVAESGPFDLETLMNHAISTQNDFMLSEIRDGLANPNGDSVMQRMLRQSPALLIKNKNEACKPILIIHGKNDKAVPFKTQAEEADKAFSNSQLELYNEGHTIIANKKDRYKKILKFLDFHMN